MKINVRRMILTAMLTGIALVIFIIEMQIPAPVAIPGIKLGLANIVTLFALVLLGGKDAFAVLFIRILLSGIFTGGFNTVMYSAAGGICCFIVMYISLKILKRDMLWVISALGATAHNMGQLTAAWLFTGSIKIFVYMPVLAVSGIITGIFTGLCAYYVLKNRHIERLAEKLR